MSVNLETIRDLLAPGGAVAAVVALAEVIRRDRATRTRDEAAKRVQVSTAMEAKTAAVEAKEKAAEAAELARPTGNGFAGATTADLKALLAGQQRIEASQRQQAEISGRTVSRLDEVIKRQDRTDDRLATHMDDHLRGLLKEGS